MANELACLSAVIVPRSTKGGTEEELISLISFFSFQDLSIRHKRNFRRSSFLKIYFTFSIFQSYRIEAMLIELQLYPSCRVTDLFVQFLKNELQNRSTNISIQQLNPIPIDSSIFLFLREILSVR